MRNWKVSSKVALGFAAFSAACLIGVLVVGAVVAKPMISQGAAPSPAAVELVTTLLGLASGGGVASILALVSKMLPYFGNSPTLRLLVDAVDVGRVATYKKLYAESTDPVEKESARKAARTVLDVKFEEWFPVDAASKGV